MQIRSGDLTAPQSLKKSVKKMGRLFARVI